MVAAQSGHADIVEYLLRHLEKEDAAQQSDDGATVFHMAAGTVISRLVNAPSCKS